MYFVMGELSRIDPMYQYSLSFFKRLFLSSLKRSDKSAEGGVEGSSELCLGTF